VSERFVIEPLSANHDRIGFSCGIDALDRYLHTQAGQDFRRRISNCFVATLANSTDIAGYYTLAAASIPFLDLPQELSRRLPRYPVLPAALIGRLAVDRRYRKRALGSALLYDAIDRASRSAPAVFAMVVDAKDESAASFYRHFGFQPFADLPMRRFLTMATAAKLSGR
jgi:ribosomal protein S18 acetylase RimI-like enzyme